MALVVALCAATAIHADEPAAGERIVIIGNGLAHRMQYFPHFETQLHRQFPDAGVVIRNLARPGDTPGGRPHASQSDLVVAGYSFTVALLMYAAIGDGQGPVSASGFREPSK